MLLKLHPDNPSERNLRTVSAILETDGVIIFPTDTVYALACSIHSKKGFDRLCRIKRIKPKKAVFSMIASNMQQASPYLSQLSTPQFRTLNGHLPGPFTFIVHSSRELPSHMRNGRKTIGLRIPDHTVTLSIVNTFNTPLITTSLRLDDEFVEYMVDTEEIEAEFGKQVDAVIDGGSGDFVPSTVVSLVDGGVEVVRQGKGVLN